MMERLGVLPTEDSSPANLYRLKQIRFTMTQHPVKRALAESAASSGQKKPHVQRTETTHAARGKDASRKADLTIVLVNDMVAS